MRNCPICQPLNQSSLFGIQSHLPRMNHYNPAKIKPLQSLQTKWFILLISKHERRPIQKCPQTKPHTHRQRVYLDHAPNTLSLANLQFSIWQLEGLPQNAPTAVESFQSQVLHVPCSSLLSSTVQYKRQSHAFDFPQRFLSHFAPHQPIFALEGLHLPWKSQKVQPAICFGHLAGRRFYAIETWTHDWLGLVRSRHLLLHW